MVEVDATHSDLAKDPIRARIYGILAFIESLTPSHQLPAGGRFAKALQEIDSAFTTWLKTQTLSAKRLMAAKQLMDSVPASSAKYRLLTGIAVLENDKVAASIHSDRAFQFLVTDQSGKMLKTL